MRPTVKITEVTNARVTVRERNELRHILHTVALACAGQSRWLAPDCGESDTARCARLFAYVRLMFVGYNSHDL